VISPPIAFLGVVVLVGAFYVVRAIKSGLGQLGEVQMAVKTRGACFERSHGPAPPPLD
jgi:hypothetical protein